MQVLQAADIFMPRSLHIYLPRYDHGMNNGSCTSFMFLRACPCLQFRRFEQKREGIEALLLTHTCPKFEPSSLLTFSGQVLTCHKMLRLLFVGSRVADT